MVCAVLRYVLTHLRVVQDGGAGQLALLTASGQGFGQSLAHRHAQHMDGTARTLLLRVRFRVGFRVRVRSRSRIRVRVGLGL